MLRFRSMSFVLVVFAAAACSASDATKPETVSGPRVGSVQIELARIPNPPLASEDTISVRAVVRDTDGNLMSDVTVAWELRDFPGETDYIGAGDITRTGPNTAVVTLDAPRGVVVASAKGIFGELVLALGSAP